MTMPTKRVFKFKPWKVDQMCRETVRARGLFIMAVVDDDPNKNLFYTVGNHDRGKPEFITVGGNDLDLVSDLLAYFSIQQLKEGELKLGDHRIGEARFPMRLIDAPLARGEMSVAERYYKHLDFRVLQILTPDRSGVFPGEPGCQPPYSDVTIYAERGDGGRTG